MNVEGSEHGKPGEPVESLIEQSRVLIAKARETLDRAELLVARAQANRRASLAETEDRRVLMVSLTAMQGARTDLVAAIQQTTQAMHLTTRYVQAREKFIQARVEWDRRAGK